MYGKTGKNHHNSKSVLQFDKNNNFIKEWKNAKLAAKELNISYCGINSVCNNKTKISGGFIWKFKNN